VSTLPEQFQIGEFVIHPASNHINRGGVKQSVEPKVIELLCYLAQRPLKVISRQELIENLWPGHVSDGAVNRVVTLIRKSFEDDSAAPSYIETIPKKGYRLIADVNFDVSRDEVAEFKKAKAASYFKRNWSFLLSLLVLTGVLGYLSFNQTAPSDSKQITNPSFKQLTSLYGFEGEATLSADNQWLMYRHRTDASNKFNLNLQSIETGKVTQLTNTQFHERAPAFSPDGESIAFIRKGQNFCRIMTMKLLPDGEPGPEREMYKCGAFDHYSNVTWSKDGNHLYFTDRLQANRPYQIHKLNVNTLKVETITNELDNFYGDNEIALSPSGRYLAFFRNKYWGNNQVYVRDLETAETKKIKELGFLAWNISWTPDEQHLLYSDNRTGGQLMLLNINSGQTQSIYRSSTAINGPELTKTGEEILYSSKTADVDLHNIELKADSKKQSTLSSLSSSKIDMQPLISKNGHGTLFQSDRNGQLQLWLEKNGILKAVTSLPSNISINSYAWHPTQPLAIVASNDYKMYQLNTEDFSISPIETGNHTVIWPSFSDDGEHIYFGSDLANDWQVWQLELSSGSTSQLTEFGGYRAQPVEGESKLVFTKYQQKGLWTFDLITKQEQPISSGTYKNDDFRVCDNQLYHIKKTSKSQLWQTSLVDDTQRLLTELPRNAQLRFDLNAACTDLTYSSWLNVSTDIMMLKLDTQL